MKQKNKTTHKHNYKLLDSSTQCDDLGFIWRMERYTCSCGDWGVSFYNTMYDTLVLPPDLNRVNEPTKEYKIING